MSDDWVKLNEAIRVLGREIAKAWHLNEIVEWLARRLA